MCVSMETTLCDLPVEAIISIATMSCDHFNVIGLREHLRSQDLAGGGVQDHQLLR